LLGQITKTSGFEGAVLVRLEKKFIENMPEMESVFVETDGRPVPFFIEWSEYSGSDTLRLKFEGYDSVAKVDEFKGCRIFLTTGEPDTETEVNLDYLKGFSVIDQENTKIGVITKIIVNPGQVLLSIDSGRGGELLVPLHEDLIRKIFRRKKIISMEIPEGLLEIN
jgi:16S rRNA processing protein RimM